MGRFTSLLNNFAKNAKHKRQNEVLARTKEEVNINANGTSGYTIKEGSNRGKVLGHIQTSKKDI